MRHPTRVDIPAGLALALALVCGCQPPSGEVGPAEPTAPRVETVNRGPVTVTLTATPGTVRLDRDIVVSLRVAATEPTAIRLPPIEDRLTGLAFEGSYDREPTTADGYAVVVERLYRLTPMLADEYRIGPMAVIYRPRNQSRGKDEWLATPPVDFSVEALVEAGPDDGIRGMLDPLWVKPSYPAIAAGVLGAALVVALAFLLWRFRHKFKRIVKAMRLSPKERAMKELASLLARRLVESGQVKEFYFGLTMIVRRYIERARGVRAPEQTTEEFLGAIQADPRFTAEVAERLGDFLQAADLVKYAAVTPTSDAVDASLQTARDYIETDAAEVDAAERRREAARP